MLAKCRGFDSGGNALTWERATGNWVAFEWRNRSRSSCSSVQRRQLGSKPSSPSEISLNALNLTYDMYHITDPLIIMHRVKGPTLRHSDAFRFPQANEDGCEI